MADPAVVETLTLAFRDDPLMSWLFADAAARPDQLRVWWDWIVDNRAPHVEVMVTDDDRSAALWHGPDPADHDNGGAFYAMVSGLLGASVAASKLQGLSVIP